MGGTSPTPFVLPRLHLLCADAADGAIREVGNIAAFLAALDKVRALTLPWETLHPRIAADARQKVCQAAWTTPRWTRDSRRRRTT